MTTDGKFLLASSCLEVLVPSGDVIRRGAVLIHRVLVEVGSVKVGLDAREDRNLQSALPQT